MPNFTLPIDHPANFMNANLASGAGAYTPSNNDMESSRSNFTATPVPGVSSMRR
jgi:hypothetical protein